MEIQLSLQASALLDIYKNVAPMSHGPERAVAYAPEFSEVRAWFDRIWDDVQSALADVTRRGKDKVAEWMSRLNDKLADARRELGDRADKLIALLQDALVQGARKVQSGLLSLLPPSLLVESVSMPLKELAVQYQLSMGGDISASLNWTLKMAAGSTVTVGAKYAM